MHHNSQLDQYWKINYVVCFRSSGHKRLEYVCTCIGIPFNFCQNIKISQFWNPSPYDLSSKARKIRLGANRIKSEILCPKTRCSALQLRDRRTRLFISKRGFSISQDDKYTRVWLSPSHRASVIHHQLSIDPKILHVISSMIHMSRIRSVLSLSFVEHSTITFELISKGGITWKQVPKRLSCKTKRTVNIPQTGPRYFHRELERKHCLYTGTANYTEKKIELLQKLSLI